MGMAPVPTPNVHLDNVAITIIDVPGEEVNTLKVEFASQIYAIIKQLRENKELHGMVFVPAEPDNFIAGADINMTGNCKVTQEAEVLARQGQQLITEAHALPIPVIAATRGARLGDGLELALACHDRVRADDPKTVLGLSEVQPGLLPGSGGTQHLPYLIGVSTALEMILTGKQLRARQAAKLGLVDDIVPHSILLEVAVELIEQDRPFSRPLLIHKRILAGPLGRALLFEMVSKKTEHKAQGNYSATERILEVVETGLTQGINSGYDAEARAFDKLAMAPQSQVLRNIFFTSTEVKKDPGSGAPPTPLSNTGIPGGGLMGGGIAYVTACKAGLSVRTKDTNPRGINHTLRCSWDQSEDEVRRHRLKASEHDKQLALISGTTDYCGFAHRDLIIEVVFENLGSKQQMVTEVRQNCVIHTIFVSNTSSLPIGDIAAHTT